jgi:DNA adenine methylase
MVITVNEIPAMREAFHGLPMEAVDIRYSVGGGGRGNATSGELIIRSW